MGWALNIIPWHVGKESHSRRCTFGVSNGTSNMRTLVVAPRFKARCTHADQPVDSTPAPYVTHEATPLKGAHLTHGYNSTHRNDTCLNPIESFTLFHFIYCTANSHDVRWSKFWLYFGGARTY